MGRDLLVDLLTRLGAEVIPAGRSDKFVPIDTENIETEQLDTIRTLAREHENLWAIVSIDGDSDRPLILSGSAKFFPGDLVGMIVAEYLGADAVVVPISCNDAIDRSTLADVLEPKTKIGSPFVIAGMASAASKGRSAICGWEANGGFLLGSDIVRNGRKLTALATRDAFLPILSVLFAAAERGTGIDALFADLPKRFSKSGLLKDFPRETGLAIVQRLTPPKQMTTSTPALPPVWLVFSQEPAASPPSRGSITPMASALFLAITMWPTSALPATPMNSASMPRPTRRLAPTRL